MLDRQSCQHRSALLAVGMDATMCDASCQCAIINAKVTSACTVLYRKKLHTPLVLLPLRLVFNAVF